MTKLVAVDGRPIIEPESDNIHVYIDNSSDLDVNYIPSNFYETALNYMTQGLCMYDSEQRVILSNRHFAEMYNLTEEQMCPGTTLSQVVAARVENGQFGESTPENYLLERTAPVTQASDKVQVLLDGRSILIRRRPLPNGGWVTTHEDITERRQAEARVAHLARHDPLTGLANRAALQDYLAEAVKRVRRGDEMAVLWIDLDKFKLVNDSYGHGAGDQILQHVADRLRDCVRETDSVARLGGDEFAVLQLPIKNTHDAVALSERLLAALHAPFEVEDQIITIGCSIGIAIADKGNCEPTQLMRNADFALYRAKTEGCGTFRFFEPCMNAQMRKRRKLEQELREAIVNHEFELYYQPIVSVKTRCVSTFEALVRWRHPERGMMPPIEFISVAEETGLILPLGQWVLAQACRDAVTWPDDISVAVNFSAAQFKNFDLLGDIKKALTCAQLAPKRLQIEITESFLMADEAHTLGILTELKKIGVCIAMDDFGTGYSSLSYLNRFPIDKLKIDRSFIKELPSESNALAILRSVAGLGSSLGMVTTAEGVETKEQLAIVEMEGCSEVQGYFFSAPRPAHEVPDLIEECLKKYAMLPRSTQAD